MSRREADGRAESIRRRLRNELRARGEDVALGLQRYAVERLLYRLGRSRHRERFVLKGATLFAIWGTAYRPTRDIDFTGYGSAEQADVIRDFREICDTEDVVDRLVFDTANITAERIRDGSEYDGMRIRVRARSAVRTSPSRSTWDSAMRSFPAPKRRSTARSSATRRHGSSRTRANRSSPRS
jgi:hypothetical protein